MLRESLVVFAVMGGLAVSLTSCPNSKEERKAVAGGQAGSPNAGIEVKVDEAVKAKARDLAGKVKDGEFPYADRSKQDNAAAFLYLAATAVDKPQVVAAALEGMAATYRSYAKAGQQGAVTEDYRKVVLKWLRTGSGSVLGNALLAAKNATSEKPQDKAVFDAVTHIIATHTNPVARYQAMEIIPSMANALKSAALVDGLLSNLDSDKSYVVSGALYGFIARYFRLSHKKAEVVAKAKKLMEHSDEGVRGHALELYGKLAESGANKAAAIKDVTAKLADRSPYVRSVAMSRLAELNATESIPKILSLLSDTNGNSYSIQYTKLNGKPGIVVHDGSNYSRVDDAVIWAIRDFAYHTKDKFKPGKRESGLSVSDWIKREGKRAREWYEKNKGSL